MINRIKNFFKRSGSRVKVPTVLQMEAVECGAACLAMILAHYGQWVPLEKLRQECGVNRDGVKAGNINRAARKRGCTAEGFRYRADQLLDKQYPLIIHWELDRLPQRSCGGAANGALGGVPHVIHRHHHRNSSDGSIQARRTSLQHRKIDRGKIIDGETCSAVRFCARPLHDRAGAGDARLQSNFPR